MTDLTAWLDVTRKRIADSARSGPATIELARWDAPALLAAVDAVLDLHARSERCPHAIDCGCGWCRECGLPWPCDVVHVVADALGTGAS